MAVRVGICKKHLSSHEENRSNVEQFRFAISLGLAALLSSFWITSVDAGMPAILPSSWTADSLPDQTNSGEAVSAGAVALRIQAISFFLVVFLLSGWLVKGLVNSARRDFPKLPALSYGRSLGLVALWGMLFVVVLTMISGTRELMTPGAWQKQGWTYTLASTKSEAIIAGAGRAARQRGLEQLRTAVWQYAATHEGLLPRADEPSIEPQLWAVPGSQGLSFLAVPNCRAEVTGRLFAFEPDAEGDDRLVLLTNGFIGTMRTAEINQSLAERHGNPAAEAAESNPLTEVSATAPKLDDDTLPSEGANP